MSFMLKATKKVRILQVSDCFSEMLLGLPSLLVRQRQQMFMPKAFQIYPAAQAESLLLERIHLVARKRLAVFTMCIV